MRARLLILLLGLVVSVLPLTGHAQAKGIFKGEVVASFLRDGRNMKLERPFGFIDSKGTHWDVPAGAVTDGASIPRVLWVSYPPFTGLYRSAAVVHDYFCQVRSRSWQETHEVFYEAMRASGVDDTIAKVMYAVVYRFGPRWTAATRGATPAVQPLESARSEDQLRFLKDMQAWIGRQKPPLAEIARRVERGG
jgi:hypothetical protein